MRVNKPLSKSSVLEKSASSLIIFHLQPHQERPHQQRHDGRHLGRGDGLQREKDQRQIEQPAGVVDHLEAVRARNHRKQLVYSKK